jgi:hypothetical protein
MNSAGASSPVSFKRYGNLFIQYNSVDCPDFLGKITQNLRTLESREVGYRLIDRILRASHPVWIYYRDEKCHTRWKGDGLFSTRRVRGTTSKNMKFSPEGAHGTGAEAWIELDPKAYDTAISPFFINLGHELIHAYHIVYGKVALLKYGYPQDEEFHTVFGFASKKPHRTQPKISENALRYEHHLPVASHQTRFSLMKLKEPIQVNSSPPGMWDIATFCNCCSIAILPRGKGLTDADTLGPLCWCVILYPLKESNQPTPPEDPVSKSDSIRKTVLHTKDYSLLSFNEMAR